MEDSAPVTVARPSTSAVARRRTHHEVIDVDEFDDHRPPRRPRLQVHSSENLTPSDIIVLDSDDGVETGPSTQPRPAGGRLRSPPPPIQTVHAPPPVPPLPSRHRPRQQARAFPPDVVRPNVEPFAFERAMVAHVPRPASHPPLGDASRPRPIINLGGGFVSLSNRHETELLQHQQARDQARQRYFDRLRIARGIHQRHGFLSQTIGRIFPTWLFGDPTEEEMMDALAFSDLAAAEVGPFEFGGDRAQPRRAPHEYRIAYTHPYPPAPGFAHNFESPSPSITVIDVDEEPGPSGQPTGSNLTSENMNTLVCARCLDPLVLGGSSMPEDERTRRRLWSLRCGHMLDGKCIAELMKPQPTPDIEPTSMEVTGTDPSGSRTQGEDHTVDTPSPVSPRGLVLDGTVHLDRGPSARTTKARGAVDAIERQPEPSQLAMDGSEPAISTEDSSIRSRLRPRNVAGHVVHTSSSSSTSFRSSTRSSSQRISAPVRPAPSLTAVASAVPQTKRRPKGKGKQKVVEPLILGRHEWRCPVALCERLHQSLDIENQGWVMDETQGAIPIFA
ncbi:hypothetical protein EDB85DRAFT_1954744 [Lactarius pseudohatsudake]|nr:hypothetical protein EDB85DRAFT_1954744 [Lactarius pseudohatsudake]